MEELTDFEKMIEGVTMLARAVRAYYESLIENGFEKEEAIFLTSEYQSSIMNLSKKKGD